MATTRAGTSGNDAHTSFNHTRPPSPGDDASPFLLRIYVTRGTHFRPMQDFEHGLRPWRDEYKVYVWRSTPLRTLTQLLHSCDPTISQPLTPHSFRLVYYNSRKGKFGASTMGQEITRISKSALADKLSSDDARRFAGLASDEQEDSVIDGARKLAEFGIVDGDIVECLVPDERRVRGRVGSGHGGHGGHSVHSGPVSAPPVPSRHHAEYRGGWGPPRSGGW